MLPRVDAGALGLCPQGRPRPSRVIAPDREELIVHHGPASWNLVCGLTRWVLIDWENAGPGSRLWDLAYAAHGFVRSPPAPPLRRHAEDWSRWRRATGWARMSGESRLWSQGHGDAWLADAAYVERHLAGLRSALLDAD